MRIINATRREGGRVEALKVMPVFYEAVIAESGQSRFGNRNADRQQYRQNQEGPRGCRYCGELSHFRNNCKAFAEDMTNGTCHYNHKGKLSTGPFGKGGQEVPRSDERPGLTPHQ